MGLQSRGPELKPRPDRYLDFLLLSLLLLLLALLLQSLRLVFIGRILLPAVEICPHYGG